MDSGRCGRRVGGRECEKNNTVPRVHSTLGTVQEERCRMDAGQVNLVSSAEAILSCRNPHVPSAVRTECLGAPSVGGVSNKRDRE